MIRVIMGKKGSGKTKNVIEMINNAVQTEHGSVVCIEKGNKLTFDIHYHIRLVEASEYDIANYTALKGFISGMYAGNYDITHIFVDATLKIGGRDYEAFAGLVDRLLKLPAAAHVELVFTVSCDASELPERLGEYILK